MADGYGIVERWTLRSLLGAFLDLAIAYIFLCAAAVAFAAAKFFSFFGVGVGVGLACRHYPPFALRPTPSGAPSVCSPRILLLHNNNNNIVRGCRRRRRRRRASVASSSRGEFSEWEWESESESESESASSPAPPAPLRLGWRSIIGETPANSLDERGVCDRGDGFDREKNYDLTIEKLKRALEEERAARAALSRELEKERSAAGSAADEAMAMMLRLQEEKAAVDIESRQYRRMVEEKSAYDEEEMETLKEIVLRRERENYVLEMELVECQQMITMMNNNGSGEQLQRDPDAVAVLHGNYESEDDSRCRDITLHSIGRDDGATDKDDGRVYDYDVHVIDDDDKIMSLGGDQNAEHLKPSEAADISVGRPTTEMEEDPRGSSLSVVDAEKLVLGKEVVILRKRLEAIQQGRDKLRFPLDQAEISYQLEEIKKATEAED